MRTRVRSGRIHPFLCALAAIGPTSLLCQELPEWLQGYQEPPSYASVTVRPNGAGDVEFAIGTSGRVNLDFPTLAKSFGAANGPRTPGTPAIRMVCAGVSFVLGEAA